MVDSQRIKRFCCGWFFLFFFVLMNFVVFQQFRNFYGKFLFDFMYIFLLEVFPKKLQPFKSYIMYLYSQKNWILHKQIGRKLLSS